MKIRNLPNGKRAALSLAALAIVPALMADEAIINEIMFDPEGTGTFDSNGDGFADAWEDEYVEIVNGSGSSLDLSGWTLEAVETPSMLRGLGDWKAHPIFTVGETLPTTNALNSSVSAASDYTPVGILDGLGAFELDANTVRVFANHELLNFRGYPYDVSDGSGGTFSLSGARVSYFDIDRATRQIVDSGLAYNTIYDATGSVATSKAFLANDFDGFSRFCSSVLVEPQQFGAGNGLTDRIYFTGEEDGGFFNGVGGALWALDAATGDFWHVPAMGRGAWENITEIDTGTTTHVAFILADDTSPFDFNDDDVDEASPLFLYVGEKNASGGSGNFLDQNGLETGKLYVWVADSGETVPSAFNGDGAVLTAAWVEVDNASGGSPSEDGSTGYDEYGFPTQGNLWLQADAVGAFGFSRPEDVAVNPWNGAEIVLASTGVDNYDGGSDAFGTLYTVETDFTTLTAPTSTITILYDGDADPQRRLRSPDNLDWADNGVIYVQEDKAEDSTIFGEPLFGPGATNQNEAGIVAINPTDGNLWRIANVNREVVLDPTTTGEPVDVDAGVAGEWESSGILDVSSLFGEAPGTLFLADVQAHGIEDQTDFNADSRISDFDLREGGQLLFLSNQPAMLKGIGGWDTTPIFTVGETLPTTNALNAAVSSASDYTPVGILDGLGAYTLDGNTVRVFANHELLNFRGYPYDVSDGSGGTFSLSGARVSYFDIDTTTLRIVDSGLAYHTIYDATGSIATDSTFLQAGFSGFSRFCSSVLVEPEQFGTGNGLADRIYFTGEEDGGFFNGVGGGLWALDTATGNFWQVPAMGRGAWENITEIDTGTTTHVAFILADDTSPFDFNDDDDDEAAPLFLYVGEKNASGGSGNFLDRNGLETGKLYVWVADNGDTLPSHFNGATSSRTGTWAEVDNANTGTPSEDGSSGYDEFGYPTQGNLWLQADTLGAFGFSRPEDVAVNPFDGAEIVLASTGVDNYDDGADTFGTLYLIDTDFTTLTAPTSTVSILYDGDEDVLDRALRSPDNLEWADDGYIYVQEDEAEESSLTGEPLFGPGATNPNEAGIVKVDPITGAVTRIANIDRSVILDPTTTGTPVDVDAGDAGEWESSGIIDVSSLFGRDPGTLFLADVQAHGIEDQDNFNADSRITDFDLREGGQLLFLEPAPMPFIFPVGTIVEPGGSVVVFGGGTPMGSFGDSVVLTSSGSLGLEDTGRVLSIFDAAGNQIDSVDYTGAAAMGSGDGESIVRDPDLDGAFTNHSIAGGSGGALGSPGTKTDGSLFSDAFNVTDFVLQVLHASDLEGGVDAISRAPNFAAIVEYYEEENPNGADGTVVLSAGDNYIPGPFFNASSDFGLEVPLELAYESLFAAGDTLGSEIETRNGAVDITIMNLIRFDASAIGNHEFDVGSEVFRDLLEEEFDPDDFPPSNEIVPLEVEWPGSQFPFVAANLDFSEDEALAGLFTSDILPASAFSYDPNVEPNKFAIDQGDSTKIAPATIVDANGERVGVVGATTQRLEQISSPNGTSVIGANDNDMLLLAAQLQPVIDDIIDGDDDILGNTDDVNKIVIVTHLQQLSLEIALAAMLRGVDVIIAGGSDSLLADSNDVLRAGDSADGEYPYVAMDADNNPTLIVSTDGEYSYVGRLNVPFNAAGVVLLEELDDTINGPVATTEANVLALWGNLTDPFLDNTRGGEVAKLVNEVESIVTTQDGNIFGYTSVYLDGSRSTVRTQESNMGNLTADANLWKARQTDPNVVISFKNGGGLRNPIGEVDGVTGELLPPQGNPLASKPLGAISELDIADVLRFNNGLVTFDLSGADILAVLEHGFAASFEGQTQGRFPQLGGLQVSYVPPVDSNGDGSINPGDGDTEVEIRSFALINADGRVTDVLYDDGAFVGAAETMEYTIVTLNFLADDDGNFGTPGETAGDGYPFPGLGDPSSYVDTGVGEVEALQEYLMEFHPTGALAFSEEERDITQDARIQNFAMRFDTVGNDIPVAPPGALTLEPIATFHSGIFDDSATEIVAYDPISYRLFTVSAGAGEILVLDASDPDSGTIPLIDSIQAPFTGFEPNSVDVYVESGYYYPAGVSSDAVVATAWADPANGRGYVTIHDAATLTLIDMIQVGYLPDMLTFTPDGKKLVVANEGEPTLAGDDGDGFSEDDVLSDNPGSVSVIDFTLGYDSGVHHEITFDRWNRREDVLKARGVVTTYLDNEEVTAVDSISMDLEPEYVAVSPDGLYAWVSLQEANAVAIVDLTRYAIRNILPLGVENFSVTPFDPSDRDGRLDDEDRTPIDPINIGTWPVWGLRQPDAIAAVWVDGQYYLLTANEGDARDGNGFEEARVGDFDQSDFDPSHPVFSDPTLLDNEKLGRLEFNTGASDVDGDGDFDAIMAYGGRSMTVFESPIVGRFRAVGGTSTSGNNDMEEYVASRFANVFHFSNDSNEADELENRSDAKGVEPEAITVAEIEGRLFAFIGLERQSALMVYDVTEPWNPIFQTITGNRDFTVDADLGDDVSNPLAGDLGPEGIEFIPAFDSPTGYPMIAVANEVSGTVTLWKITFGIGGVPATPPSL